MERKAIGISILSHILWGFYPVCARYLQTKPKLPLDGITLLAVAQLCALGINMIISCVCGEEAHHEKKIIEEEAKSPMIPKLNSDFESAIQATDSSNKAENNWRDQKNIRLILGFGFMGAARATTNICSTKLTYAYNIQLISMSSPLITAIVSSFLISEHLPWTLWPCLLFAGLGEAIVLLAQAGFLHQIGHPPTTSLTSRDVLGLSLQFISLFFSAFARVMMVTTSKVLTPSQLMSVQYIFTSIPILVYSTMVNFQNSWKPWLFLDLENILVFIFFVLGVFTLAATSQVHAIRLLGPGGHVAYQPIRLASTMIGSELLLKEPIGDPIEGIGITIVFVTLIWYLASGKQCGLETDITGKGTTTSIAATKSRWWFQRLLWPRPSYRAPTRKRAVREGSNERRKRIEQRKKEKKRTKSPTLNRMIRTDSDEFHEDSEEDMKLLGHVIDKNQFMKHLTRSAKHNIGANRKPKRKEHKSKRGVETEMV